MLSSSDLYTQLSASKSLSPRLQNSRLEQEEEFLAQFSSLQKSDKENMPIASSSSAGSLLLDTESTSSTSSSVFKKISQPPIKRRKLEPYVLLPTLKQLKARASLVERPESREESIHKGKNAVAAALSKQFSRTTALNERGSTGVKPNGASAKSGPSRVSKPKPTLAPLKRLLSDDEEEGPRKRPFVDSERESSPDELLLRIESPTRTPQVPKPPPRRQVEVVIASSPASFAKKAKQRAESPTPSSAAGIGTGVSRLISPEAAPQRKGKEREQTPVKKVDEEVLTGPISNVYAKEPSPSQAEAVCVARIFSKALKDAEAVANPSSERYRPPPEWYKLTRVPGHRSFESRSQTRTERYSKILEDLYGPGSVFRGHGRKPDTSKMEVEKLFPSDREGRSSTDGGRFLTNLEQGKEEESLSDSAPPQTPSDEVLFTAAHAPLLSSPIVTEKELPTSEKVQPPVDIPIPASAAKITPPAVATPEDQIPAVSEVEVGKENGRKEGEPGAPSEEPEVLEESATSSERDESRGNEEKSMEESEEEIEHRIAPDETEGSDSYKTDTSQSTVWEAVTPGVIGDIRAARKERRSSVSESEEEESSDYNDDSSNHTPPRRHDPSPPAVESEVSEEQMKSQWEVLSPAIKEEIRKAEEKKNRPQGPLTDRYLPDYDPPETVLSDVWLSPNNWGEYMRAVIENRDAHRTDLEGRWKFQGHIRKVHDSFKRIGEMVSCMFGRAEVNEYVGRVFKELEGVKNLPEDHLILQDRKDNYKLRLRAARIVRALRVNEVLCNLDGPEN